ncbi:cytoplasmic dynein 2 intermediate chain 1 isoform X2 [Stigmatopora argus]
MHHEKKISMEDTWTSAELKKHIPRRKEQESDRRQHRGGESVERRHRDQREHHVERRDLHTEERRADRDRRTERDKSEDGHRRGNNSREDKERRAKVRLREDNEEEDRRKMKEDKERQREERNKSRHREERDKERRREGRPREERDKERRVERDTERQREERDKERREERDKERQTQERDKERREERDMERREERQREERDKERQRAERDKERREERDKERQTEERDKERREERDRERRREERDKERHREERNKERQTEERDRQRRREERDTERREERDQERREERDKERPREERERERRREDRDTERREEREKERREERDKERQREERDKERREERIKERQTEERDKERRREEKDMERQMEERDKERQTEETDKERRREEKEKERQREERDKERREERVKERHTEERRREEKEKERQREERDQERQREHPDKERLREEPDRRRHDERRDDQDRRERHEARKHSREKREQYRRQREERERRHKERALGDETPRRDRPEEPEGERGERETSRERQWREATERHHSRTRGAKPSPGRETETTKAQEAVLHSRHVATKDAGDKPATKVECLQEYDDDFEEYEEDFEDLDEDGVGDNNLKMSEEVKAIQRAMGEENERVRASFSTLGKEEEEEKPQSSQVKREEKSSRSLQRGKFIDFVAAKKREAGKKVAMKQKKRSAEMLRLIDLDLSTTVSLLDLPPVSEYDMYIRNFGAANTKQAYVQWNEENADRDIQTEEVDLSEKWTQHPAELSGACGDPNRTNETRSISEMNSDSRRLAVFLHAASQVMAVLLEEDHAERSSLQGRKTQKDALSFSDGSLQLNTNLHFLRGRVISQVLFSQAQRHTLLSVHMPSASPDDVGPHHRCTLVCVWNMWEPSRPRKILLCDSEVQCCCFSPGKATLVFAGTDIGSVELWDLREPDGNHQRQKVGEDEWTFRRPTFSTDAAPSAHFSSVTSVEVVTTTLPGGPGSEVAFLPSEEELLGLSFQLASLDENGLLNLWVVVQLAKANEAGSQTDLGLRPGGKVKLLHSSGCVTAEGVSPSHADKTGPVQSLHLKFLPTDPSHFFIGNNTGVVSHGTTQGLKALPRCYSSQDFSTRLVDVTAIQFSPFKPHLFLVGCNDGSVRLHDFKSDKAVAEWTVSTAGKSVVSLQWSQTRPAVFCALDAASRLYIWDLLKRETAPVVTERLDADRLTAMAAFGDPAQQNTYSGIATAHQSGKIEMHYFTREFTIQSSEEEKTLEGKILESF